MVLPQQMQARQRLQLAVNFRGSSAGRTAYTGCRELLWLKAFETIMLVVQYALKVAESCKSEAIQDSVRGFFFRYCYSVVVFSFRWSMVTPGGG